MTCNGDEVDTIWDGEEWQKVACSGCAACKPHARYEMREESLDKPDEQYHADGAMALAKALNASIDYHTRSLQRMADEMNKQQIKPNRKDKRRYRFRKRT
jgi:hypothetical protein